MHEYHFLLILIAMGLIFFFAVHRTSPDTSAATEFEGRKQAQLDMQKRCAEVCDLISVREMRREEPTAESLALGCIASECAARIRALEPMD